MDLTGTSAIVTGGASGLGLATVERLRERGANVTILDLADSDGKRVADQFGDGVVFSAGDVTDAEDVSRACQVAVQHGPVRTVIHCAGRGGRVRVLEPDGSPGDLELFETVLRVNTIGTFNVLRFAAAHMVKNEPLDGDRGVFVLTGSVAAWDGRIGQLPYAASKAGVVAMTFVAARDLAERAIRVCSIAPGPFDTPMLGGGSDEFKVRFAADMPHPTRLGRPDEFARLTLAVIDNPMLNGESIRLDGALRMRAT
jgi:NAD(P)-dependent dehydrogenase (short-subunit alcohol dehydrogenase family)